MTTDPRIEAAAQGIWQWHEENAASNAPTPTSHDMKLAAAALAAADAVDPLRQPGHRVEINGDDWTLQHPAECRPNMLACSLNISVREYDVTAMADGNYTVVMTGEGDLLLMAELNS